MRGRSYTLFVLPVVLLLLFACRHASAAAQEPPRPALKVLAVESFLSDIAQNVAGDRLKVATLLPSGVDPHSFEPTPADVVKVAECGVLIANGAGLEEFLEKLLKNAGGVRKVVEASEGLEGRKPQEGETAEADSHGHERDPHFWLSP